jgi:MFS family permease
MVIAYIDRANLSAALAEPSFVKYFSLSDVDRGNLASAFFWTYALLQIPAGFLVDRFGVKFPYAISFLFWSLVSAATALTTGFQQLFALRLLLGVGESVVTPASLRWIRFNVDERQRGLAVGLYMAGTKIGSAIGIPIAAWLIVMYDWRAMFLILGLGCLIWLIPWMTLVRNDDRKLEAAVVKASAAPAISFGRVMKSPAMWGIILGTFSYNYFVYFCMTWLPAYFREQHHLTPQDMGLLTMTSFAGMATMATVAGWLADKLIERGQPAIRIRKIFTIAGFVVASTEVIGALSSSREVALLFAVVSLTGLGITTANYWALTQSLMPGAAVGRITGVQNFASNLGGVMAPLITGWLKQTSGGYAAPLQFIWVLLVMGIASYVFLVRPKFAPQKE